MKIGIVGVGMVGEVVRYGMERLGHDVACHDTRWAGSYLGPVLDADLVFICVPTPSRQDGSCDTSIVEQVVLEIDDSGYDGLVVLKSTVTPGTTDQLEAKLKKSRIAFCPEFLKEKSRFVDFVENHDVCIVGAYSEEDFDLVVKAHGSLPKQFVMLYPTDAEMAKYFSNVFNAMRIVFANQFYDVCEKAGCSYTEVKNAVTKRTSIGDHYLDCNKNFREFSGNCLPKDTRAFAKFAKDIGADTSLWDDIVMLNEITGAGQDAKVA